MSGDRERPAVDGTGSGLRLIPRSLGIDELVGSDGARRGTVAIAVGSEGEVEIVQGAGGPSLVVTVPGKIRCLCFPGSWVSLGGRTLTLESLAGEGAPSVSFEKSQRARLAPAKQGVATQAAIMAGGRATRLEPISGVRTGRSKPDVPIARGVSLIKCIAESLVSIGITNIFVNTHFAPERLRAGLASVDARFEFLHEPRPSGTAGPIIQALSGDAYSSFDAGRPLLIMQGDALSDMDLRILLETHGLRRGRGVTIGVKTVREDEVHKYGIVDLEPAREEGQCGRVTRFLEKPTLGEAGDRRLASTGIYVLGPDVYPWLMECHSRKRERGRRASERLELMELDFARDLFPSILAARGTTSLPGWRPSPTEIHAVRLSGYWNDIGSPDQYFKGVADIASGQVRLIGDPAPLDTDPSGVIYWDDGRRALEEARGAARGRVIVLPADDPSLGGPCKL